MSRNAALHYLELAQVASLIRQREISSRELTTLQLERIAALDGKLHCYEQVTADSALAQADAADAAMAAGRPCGPLHGVPIAVKDLCQVAGLPTGAGMALPDPQRAADDATVVQRLKQAGCVLLGTLQLTEGAYSDHHPSITAPRNPWNAAYWSGISSSGSAVATAAGLCYGSLASDTGGSIRWPAAANGLTGMKPTWGRVSRHGVFPLAPSLDHVGTLTRSAVDAAILLAAIAGADARDPSTLLHPVPDYAAALGGDLRGLRIGVDPAWNSADVDAATQAVLAETVKALGELGAELVETAFPDVTQAVADWVANCAVEAAVAHQTRYAAHQACYGKVLTSVIEAGQALSGMDYQQILLRRMAFRGRVEALFGHIDLLLTPVQPFAPLTLAKVATLGEQPDLIAMLQRYTVPFDMSGHPTLTLPGGWTREGMPIGFQLVAAHLGEATLLCAGAAYQAITDWHRRHPVL